MFLCTYNRLNPEVFNVRTLKSFYLFENKKREAILNFYNQIVGTCNRYQGKIEYPDYLL